MRFPAPDWSAERKRRLRRTNGLFAVGFLLFATLAWAIIYPHHRRVLQPNLRSGFGGSSDSSFVPSQTVVAARVPILPGEAHPNGYLGKIWVKPVYDGGTFGEAVFGDGGQMSGYTELGSTAVGPSYATYNDKGFGTFLDLSDTSKVSVSDTAVLNLPGGDYTICILGWGSSGSGHIPIFYEFNTPNTGNPHDNYSEITGGSWLCDDATLGAGPGAITSGGGLPFDGMSLSCCSRTGGVLRAFSNKASTSATLTAPSSGACVGCSPFTMGGGNFPGNSMRGEGVGAFFWTVGMGAAEMEDMTRAVAGANAAMRSTGPGYVIGEDKLADAGIVVMLGESFPHTDPLKGIRSFQGYNNWWAVNAMGLIGDTPTNGATITDHVASGPLSRYITTGLDVSRLSGPAGAGARGLAMVTNNTDGGWAAGYADNTVVAKCETTCLARICAMTTTGSIDAGRACCDMTLTNDWRRVPDNGCPAFITNDSVVRPELQLQDGGSILVAHRQATATGYPDGIRLTNLPIGDAYNTFDAGVFFERPGRLRVVGVVPYNSADMGFDKTLAKGLGYYFIDLDSSSWNHGIMDWSSVSGSPRPDGGFGQTQFDSLMYGASASFENKFSADPIEFVAGQPYGIENSWVTSFGTLPDGGQGVGCRMSTKIDACSSVLSCPYSTLVSSNTGALGTCISGAEGTITGSRGAPPGSSVTSGWTYGWELSFNHDGALLSVATASGVGMGTICACTNVTGTKGEVITTARASPAECPSADSQTFTQCPNDIPRVTTGAATETQLGFLVEPPAYNFALRSRDLSNAVWTKTNVTCTHTATGMRNDTNGASTCTATSNNGTVWQVVDHTLFAPSVRSCGSLRIKRRTGTGTIWATYDGTTFTDITSSLSSSIWKTVAKVSSVNGDKLIAVSGLCASTATDPKLGLKFATSGDAVDVDFTQIETNDTMDQGGSATWDLATSPIETAGVVVVRRGDIISVPRPTGMTDAVGCLGWTFVPSAKVFFGPQISLGSGAGFFTYWAQSIPSELYLYDGTNNPGPSNPVITLNAANGVVNTWDAYSADPAHALTGTTSGGGALSSPYDGTIIGSDPADFNSTINIGVRRTNHATYNTWIGAVVRNLLVDDTITGCPYQTTGGAWTRFINWRFGAGGTSPASLVPVITSNNDKVLSDGGTPFHVANVFVEHPDWDGGAIIEDGGMKFYRGKDAGPDISADIPYLASGFPGANAGIKFGIGFTLPFGSDECIGNSFEPDWNPAGYVADYNVTTDHVFTTIMCSSPGTGPGPNLYVRVVGSAGFQTFDIPLTWFANRPYYVSGQFTPVSPGATHCFAWIRFDECSSGTEATCEATTIIRQDISGTAICPGTPSWLSLGVRERANDAINQAHSTLLIWAVDVDVPT